MIENIGFEIEVVPGVYIPAEYQQLRSEKLKKSKFDLDDELTKPYFKLENVIDGVFKVAEKLFGLSFKEVFTIDKYHEEVKTYEVYDDAGNFISLFYADFHPRPGKRYRICP